MYSFAVCHVCGVDGRGYMFTASGSYSLVTLLSLSLSGVDIHYNGMAFSSRVPPLISFIFRSVANGYNLTFMMPERSMSSTTLSTDVS